MLALSDAFPHLPEEGEKSLEQVHPEDERKGGKA